MPEYSVGQDRLLNTSEGKGREICEYLTKELNIPDGTLKFCVTFEFESSVKVECEYYPVEHIPKQKKDGHRIR